MDGVRRMVQQVRHWLPGRRLVLVVAGGFVAVILALACVHNRVLLVSRRRWEAALDHPPRPPIGSLIGQSRGKYISHSRIVKTIFDRLLQNIQK